MLRSSTLAFLDNAASTLKPESVIEAMRGFMEATYSNVHRGLYAEAVRATELYEKAHDEVASLICAGRGEVVFTSGTTGAIHLAVLLLWFNGYIKRGSEIIVPGDAHNSNLLPWRQISRMTGARLRILPVNREGVPEWGRLDKLLTSNTSIVAVTHVSNVTGYESPVREVAEMAHEAGAIVVLDSAQGVPHMPVCVDDLGVDLLAFSGHKMLGPTGIGVLWLRRELAENLEPPLGGGGTIRRVRLASAGVEVDWEEPPYKFEAGTPPIVEAIGLAEAVGYLKRLGMEAVKRHEAELVARLLEGLSDIEGVAIIGPRDPGRRRGIVTFNLKGLHPDQVGLALARKGIAVRTGRHCADILYDALGVEEGGVRASFYIYNCPDEVDRLLGVIKNLARR